MLKLTPILTDPLQRTMTHPANPDLRQFAPATQRNREPILAVLQQILPADGMILEISSGTGEHAAFFASALAPRCWLPSDPNPIARDSIQAWREFTAAENLLPPLALDVRESVWPVEQPDWLQANAGYPPIRAIVNINMVHISPWSACLGLMAGAGRILPPDGLLYLYGPFKQAAPLAPSNAAFDQSLRMQNPEWGLRELTSVIEAAEAAGFVWVETRPMPANNLSVWFRRS
jgi:Protein of unknown function (DUF938)